MFHATACGFFDFGRARFTGCNLRHDFAPIVADSDRSFSCHGDLQNTGYPKGKNAMNSIFTLLLVAMFSAPLSCRAFEEKNILAAGNWSEPVAGAEDPHTGRGAHRPIIRGRLLLCESPKNQQPAVYLELQDCGDVWGSTKEIYCDMNSGLTFDLRDMKGEPVPMKPFAFSGGTPGANWLTLPCDSTVRLRISPYATFTPASSDDYMISGTLVVDPPADRTGLDVWQGKLKLPAMKIVVHKPAPEKQAQSDNEMTPLSYRDAESGILFLVESNRHHVVAVDKDGKILWARQPATDGKLPPYSETYPCPNPAITWIGASTVPRPNSVGISFNSRQAGALDLKAGDLTFLGQD